MINVGEVDDCVTAFAVVKEGPFVPPEGVGDRVSAADRNECDGSEAFVLLGCDSSEFIDTANKKLRSLSNRVGESKGEIFRMRWCMWESSAFNGLEGVRTRKEFVDSVEVGVIQADDDADEALLVIQYDLAQRVGDVPAMCFGFDPKGCDQAREARLFPDVVDHVE